MSSHLHHFRYWEGDIYLDLDPDFTFSYQGGFIIRKNFSGIFRMQAEPSFMLLGASYKEDFTLRGYTLQTDSRTDLYYLQLPLLLQLSTHSPQDNVYGRKQAVTTYHLTGGVYGGYLLGARFTGTNTGAPLGISFAGDFSTNVRNQYWDYDGGLVFGIGLEHGQSKKIGIESRVLYSTINSGDSPSLAFKSQHIAVSFSVYVLL